MKMKSYFKSITYYQLFILIESLFTIGFLTINLIWHGGPFWKLMLRFFTQFDDYFVHLGFASAPIGTNIYEFSDMACFPPLAYLMYGFLARLSGYQAETPAKDPVIKETGYNTAVFILYNIFCIVIMLYAISLFIKKKGFVHQVIFPSLLIFSFPIAFSTINRGNSVLLVAGLLSIALAWKNDESKVKRELAMVLIAICAGLKIYPAVFGLLYLKEKRWKETIRLVIYGAVLFFGPFVFFGGIEGLKTFFSTVFSLYGEVHEISINGMVTGAVRGVFGSKATLFATIIQQLYLILSVIAFFCAKNKRSEILILCCLMTIYISSVWMYTCIYILPAMLVFYEEHSGKPLRIRLKDLPDILPFIMFLIVFSRPFAIGGYHFVYGSIFIISSLFILYIIGATIYRKWIKPIMAFS